MARVRRCDRCGKYYEPYENRDNAIGTVTFNMDDEETVTEQYKDLCPECMDEFTNWYSDVVYPGLGKPTVEE